MHPVRTFSFVFLMLIGVHVSLAHHLTSVRPAIVAEQEDLRIWPPAVLKVMALEYQGLAADLIFSRTLSFYGGMIHRQQPFDPQTWRSIYHRLRMVSELDPYFSDPYIFGQAVLTWGGGMVPEANQLLEQGRQHRPQDWTIPFFMGFNAFYFLNDPDQGADYLMQSSQRPNAPPFVAMLASRLVVQGGRTDTAIAFLQQVEGQTRDQTTRKMILKRLEALKAIRVLERAVERYRQHHHRFPVDLQTLVDDGWLSRIPPDPYGGVFRIDPQGEIQSSSQMRPARG